MKVILEYDNVVGCTTCPFRFWYSEQGWGDWLCGHTANRSCPFSANSEGFPSGCPVSNKEVERIVNGQRKN